MGTLSLVLCSQLKHAAVAAFTRLRGAEVSSQEAFRMDCSLSISSLLCLEDTTHLDCSVPEGVPPCQGLAFLLHDEEEYIQELVSRESSCLEIQSHADSPTTSTDSWFTRARSDAIQWILATKACFGLGSRTAYLAVAYLDRFFARRRIDKDEPWVVRLVTVACLSVAAKMEEFRTPAPSELGMDGYAFDSGTVQRMELLLLATLRWRMHCVTPFDYLSYFMAKFQCEAWTAELVLRRANGFIFAFFDAFNLATHSCCTMAAAAVLAASSSKAYTREQLELKMSSVHILGCFKEKEDVVSCYNMMMEGSSKNVGRTPKRLASAEASSISTCEAVLNKRRRMSLI